MAWAKHLRRDRLKPYQGEGAEASNSFVSSTMNWNASAAVRARTKCEIYIEPEAETPKLRRRSRETNNANLRTRGLRSEVLA